ncbi:MAG: glycosyltransferase family 39 protein [Chloroflexota bacterium]
MAAGAPALGASAAVLPDKPFAEARSRPISARLKLLAALGAIVLLGFCLRAFRLDFQSLWYDETYSVHIARGPFGGVGAVPEAEPLLHYYLLWLWIHAAGFGEFATRSLSVVAGTLTLPVAYQMVRSALRNRRMAVLAAGLLAISPYAIGYSQEVRLHIFASFFAAATTYTFLASLRRGGTGRWLAYTGIAVLGLYTSYYLALLLVALNLPVLIRGPRSRAWFSASVGIIALALPGVAIGWSRLNAFSDPYPVIQALLDPGRFARITPGILLFSALPGPVGIPLGLAGLLLIVIGGWRLAHSRQSRAVVLVSGALLTYLLVFAVPATLGISYYDRYELLALPGLLALLAAGLVYLACRSRWLTSLASAGLLVATGTALFNSYATPSYQRDDNRDALALIRQQAQPDEMLIYDLPLLYTVVDYYAPDLSIPREGLPLAKNPKLPPERQFLASTSDKQTTEQELAKLSQQHAGFWLFLSGDPTQWTEDWLDTNRLPVLNRWFGNARVKHYRPLPSVAPASLAGGEPVDKSFGPLRLRQVRPGPLAPGKLWPIYLAWEAASPPDADYSVSLQLFDGHGQRVAQHDAQPFDGALPTSQWSPGKAYEDLAILSPPQRLSPGVYQLQVSVYGGGQAVGQAQIVALLPQGLMPASSSPAPTGAGWTVDRLETGVTAEGYAVAIEGSVQATPPADYTWFVHALDPGGKLIGQDDHPPLAPTSAWQAGERFVVAFRLPAAPPRGSVLEIGAYDAAGRRVIFSGSADHLLVPAA